MGLYGGHNDRIDVASCLPHENSPAPAETVSLICEPGSSLRGLIEHGELSILPADYDNPILAPLESCLPDEHISSVLLAPIRSEQQAIGLLALGMPQAAGTYSKEEIMLFDRIRYDLAGITEYAQLHDTARTLAATEERTRLARELHDSVTQVLFSASLLAEALPQIWRRDPELAAESLDGLRRLTHGALAEMRTLLLELRPASLFKTSLPELISQLTEAVTTRSGLPFDLQIEQIPVLPEDVHISFYRIAQEALNNVVKHARASRIEIRLGAFSRPSDAAPADQTVSLTISDNGVGFSGKNDQPGHMGLGIMRERATAIGADLSIESEPGRGATVALSWTGKL